MDNDWSNGSSRERKKERNKERERERERGGRTQSVLHSYYILYFQLIAFHINILNIIFVRWKDVFLFYGISNPSLSMDLYSNPYVSGALRKKNCAVL